MADIPTMLSINEIAKKTGLSRTFIRKLVWENKITYIKSGKKYLINLERFIDYLNTRQVS